MYTLICNLLGVSEAERDADFPNRVDRLLFSLFDIEITWDEDCFHVLAI